jgi:hypothetical protein
MRLRITIASRTGDEQDVQVSQNTDLLQSLETRELRERSECAICYDHSIRANCASARNARSVTLTRDVRTARALGRRDLLRSLEMRELRDRSGCAICEDHSRCANCASARNARSVAIAGYARTARALGMRDLLRSLEMRELRKRSACAICCNHSRYVNCASARHARSVTITRGT